MPRLRSVRSSRVGLFTSRVPGVALMTCSTWPAKLRSPSMSGPDDANGDRRIHGRPLHELLQGDAGRGVVAEVAAQGLEQLRRLAGVELMEFHEHLAHIRGAPR